MEITGKYSLDDILNEVCDYYNVSVDKVFGRDRYKDLVRARSMYVRLATDFTTFGPVAIGRVIDRDNATVIHYQHKMDAMSPKESEEHSELMGLLGSMKVDPLSQLKSLANLGKVYYYNKNIGKIADNRKYR